MPWTIPYATTTEPRRPRAHASRQEKPRECKACPPQLESSPCSPKLEKALEQQQRPSQPKVNEYINNCASISVSVKRDHLDDYLHRSGDLEK